MPVNSNNSLGEPLKFDPHFKGPLDKRSCTDILCLIIFVVFITCWITIGIYAAKNGDLSLVLVPRDTEGRRCGVDSGVENNKYLLFFDLMKCAAPNVPITGCKTPQVCVKECPQENFIYEVDKNSMAFDQLKKKLICKNNVNINEFKNWADLDKAIKETDPPLCAPWYLKSTSVYKRCIPSSGIDDSVIDSITKDHKSFWQSIANVKALNDLSEFGHVVVEDVVASAWYIFYGLILAMIICLAYIFLMRWMAGIMVWISIVGVMALLSYGLYICYTKWDYLRKHPLEQQDADTSTVDGYLKLQNTWMWFMIILGIILAILVIIVISLRSRITLAIALIEEGSKAVACVTSSLFFPIFPWILQSVIIAFFIMSALYISSLGDTKFIVKGDLNAADSDCICTNNSKYPMNAACIPDEFNKDCHKKTIYRTGDTRCINVYCHYVGHISVGSTKVYHAVNFIGLIWGLFFVSALSEMILAATFATWYWTFDKSRVPFFTLTKSTYRTIRYHLGTLAFGSLVITICRIIRIAIEYVDRKLKKYDNAFTRAILCMFKCLFWCLEKFLKFLNRNAYIMCAIHGKNFCASAKDAFYLLMRNVLRVFVLDKVTGCLFFFGKLFITAIVAVLMYWIFSLRTKGLDIPDLHYNAVPIVIISIGAFFIASVFFSVYTMAVDTLFLCFLEDSERNDGSPSKPFYMSKDLMKILGKRNKTT